MTIYCDNRAGSKQYAALIPGAELTRLEFGDIAFEAQGKTIGLECKRVTDAVNCLFTGRLADFQLPGCRATYDVTYLVIEGQWRPEPGTGILQWYKGELGKWGSWRDAAGRGTKRLLYSQFEGWLNTLALVGGVYLRCTADPGATAGLAQALYQWHLKAEHKSFQVMHEANGDGAELSRPSTLRRMLAHLPHIGWQRSGALLSRVSGVQFIRQDGKIMNGPDWYIEGEIAEKSAIDIDRTCEGEWK